MKPLEEVAYVLHSDHESGCGESWGRVAHEHIKDSEACIFCEAYKQAQCPTITILEYSCKNTIDCLKEEMSFENDPIAQRFLTETVSFLEARTKQIEYFVTNYVEKIASFHATKRMSHGLEDWKLQGRLETVDKERRRAHDALIASLAELTARIQELIKKGYVDEKDVVYWDGWTKPLAQLKEKTIVIFSPEITTHKRRGEIQEWAIATDFTISLQQYEETA